MFRPAKGVVTNLGKLSVSFVTSQRAEKWSHQRTNRWTFLISEFSDRIETLVK